MKRLALLLALALLLLATPASAWVASGTCGNGYLRWSSQTTNWKLRDKLSGANNYYSGLSDTAVQTAITGGWTVWDNTATCGSAWSATYAGTTTVQALANSNERVVEFFETGWPSGYGSVNSTIAVTLNSWQGCAYVDADQIYNGVGFDFTTSSNPGWNDTDLQSIAAHENGHWLGLDHTPVQSATMYASYSGGIGSRSLHADDEAGVCAIYPGQQGPSETSCTNGLDDDGDGMTDCADPDCAANASCVCLAVAALPCNGSVTGTTVGAPSTVDTYSCANWDNDGPERVYTLTTPTAGTVTVNLTGLSGDLDLFVTSGANGRCTPTSCIEESGTEGNASESLQFTATAGSTYYVVADGFDGATSPFTLAATCPGAPAAESNCTNNVDDDGDGLIDCADPNCATNPACQGGGSCAPIGALSCGGVVTGNTQGGPSDVSTWSCASWATTGPEKVYSFTPATSGSVTLSMGGLSADVDLFVTTGSGGCDGDACVGVSGEYDTDPEEIVFPATGGTTYYVVIDGYQGATSSYSLAAQCSGTGTNTEDDCDDGLDDDGDGAVDCEDFDCNGDPACTGDCTDAGACCDVDDPGSCAPCEIYLVGSDADAEALCSCFCQTTPDCPTGWTCEDIGGGDSACWPGENLCVGDDDDDDDVADDDDQADDDDATGDDDDSSGGRGGCFCASTGPADVGGASLALLGALALVTRRRRA